MLGMSKFISVVAFFVLTATGAFLYACGGDSGSPPAQSPTGTGAPASSSATPAAPSAPAAPKGGW